MKRGYEDVSGFAEESQEKAKKLSRQARARKNKKSVSHTTLSILSSLTPEMNLTNDIIFDSNRVFITFKLLFSLSFIIYFFFFLSDKTSV